MHDHEILRDIFFGSWQLRAKILSKSCWLWIGHFRVPLGLCIKTRWIAQPLIWKWFFILMQIINNYSLKSRRIVSSVFFPIFFFGTRKWPIVWEWNYRQGPVPVVWGKSIHAVCCEDNYFTKGKCKLFNSLFHSVYLLSQYFCFCYRFVCRASSVGCM